MFWALLVITKVLTYYLPLDFIFVNFQAHLL